VVVLLLAVTAAVPRWRPLGWPLTVITSVALFGVGAAPLFFGSDRAARGRVVAATAAVAGVLLLVGYHADVRARNADVDYPQFRATMDRVTAPGTTLTLLDIDELPFFFYLPDRPVRRVHRLDAFETIVRSDPRVFALVKADDLRRLTTPLEVVSRASLRGRPVAFVRRPTTS
jgi:hypothetical protein